MIRCQCPKCHSHIEAKEEAAGKAVRCPQCGQPLRIPEALRPSVSQSPTSATSASQPSESLGGQIGHVSTRFYVGFIVGGQLLFVLFGLAATFSAPALERPFLALGAFSFLCSVALELVVLYQMWVAIEGEARWLWPSLAVGGVFLPGFNLYWILAAFWGWTRDYNHFLSKRSTKARPISESLGLTVSLLYLLGLLVFTILLALEIPLAQVAVLIPLPPCTILLYHACTAVNVLAAETSDGLELKYMQMPLVLRVPSLVIFVALLGFAGFVAVHFAPIPREPWTFILVFGLAGLAAAVFALGFYAIGRIFRSGRRLKGKGLAITGVVLAALILSDCTFLLMRSYIHFKFQRAWEDARRKSDYERGQFLP